MASLATIASIATISAAVVGTGAAVYGAYQSGENAKQQGASDREAAYMLAQQEEATGREDFAASQRDARERKLEGELIMSRQQAVAAGSGGGAGADAPTIIRLMTETAKRARYGEESVLAGGRARQDRYNASAAARRISGDNSFLGGIKGAQGALLSGIGSLASGVGTIGRAVKDY